MSRLSRFSNPQVILQETMPVRTPDAYLLNANKIGERYMIHLSQTIPDFGLHNVRFIMKRLPHVPHGRLAAAINFGEIKLRNSCATLGGFQGDNIMTRITLHLHDKYKIFGGNPDVGYYTPLIAPLINILPLEMADIPQMKFLLQGQRYHLQAMTDAVEMIAAIVLYNHDLLIDPDVDYEYPIVVSDNLIHPGGVVIRSAFYLRSLLNASNFALDLAAIEAIEADLDNDDNVA